MKKNRIFLVAMVLMVVVLFRIIVAISSLKVSYATDTYIEKSIPTSNGAAYNNLKFPGGPDPYLLKENGTYYVYYTSCYGIRITKSTNFRDWVKASDQAIDNIDGYDCFWAPEVYKYNNKFYMFYTAKTDSDRDTWVAIADKPDGPFIKTSKINSKVNMPIDPNVLFDDDGKIYLYTKSEVGSSGTCCNGAGTSIYVEELNKDLLSVKGDLPKAVLTVDLNGWERGFDEGNFMIKLKGKYYLMYSTGSFKKGTYTVGYAVGDSPTGTFTKKTPNTGSSLLYGSLPIDGKFDSSKYIYGTGHNSVYYISDDEMYIVYHSGVYKEDKITWQGRRLTADYMGINDAGDLFVNGPSTDDQPLPSGSTNLHKVPVRDYTVKNGNSNANVLKDNINYKVLYTSTSLGKTPLTPCTMISTNSITINVNNSWSIEDIWLFGNNVGFGGKKANVIVNDRYIIKNYDLGGIGTAKLQLPSDIGQINKLIINFTSNVTLSEVSLYGQKFEIEPSVNTKRTVTFKNGNDVVDKKSCTIDYKTLQCSVMTPKAVSKNGYRFNGWGTSANCASGAAAGMNINVSSDETRYACFIKNESETTTIDTKRTVTFKNGDDVVDKKSCTIDDKTLQCSVMTPKEVSKSGYKFNGWGTSSTCEIGSAAGVSIDVSVDETRYACFLANESDSKSNIVDTQKNVDINKDNKVVDYKTNQPLILPILVFILFVLLSAVYYLKKHS